MDLGLGPSEWLGVLIVGVDEGIDVLPELLAETVEQGYARLIGG